MCKPRYNELSEENRLADEGQPPEEGPGYRDFPTPCEDDPEAYDEMCRQDQIARVNGLPY